MVLAQSKFKYHRNSACLTVFLNRNSQHLTHSPYSPIFLLLHSQISRAALLWQSELQLHQFCEGGKKKRFSSRIFCSKCKVFVKGGGNKIPSNCSSNYIKIHRIFFPCLRKVLYIEAHISD